MNLGYACINFTLSKKIPRITTNRGMIKKTFLERGLKYAGDLSILNLKDLLSILKWNVRHGISFFRVSSDIFPWSSHYEINKLPQYNEIRKKLLIIGEFVRVYNLRLTFHPGPFNVLLSPNENVVKNTIKDLTTHAEIFDLMGLETSHYNKINIHCNGVYGNKKKSLDRFCSNYNLLPKSVKSRLTIENDDKESMYSVKDLMYVYENIGVPIVFDYHHHKFCTGDLSEKDALNLAISTWPSGIKPVVHYSESKLLYTNDIKIKPQAHSDYITSLPNLYGNNIDVMVEAKAKELSILPFIKNL